MMSRSRKTLLLLSLTVSMGAFVSCEVTQTGKQNQKQRFASPSGRYILDVPIEPDDQGKTHYWRVTISDAHGTVLFKDDSPFFARFNVYWYWDSNDRVWLSNSDNGNVYYWEVDKIGRWQRTQWTPGNPKGLVPPRELDPKTWV